jgi:hypothetical protein
LAGDQEAEMKARQLIGKGSYGPDALKVLCEAFDEAWEDIAGSFGANTLAIQAARLKLANIILDLGRNGSNDPEEIKDSALKTMARDLRTGAS